jgi:hypothetical protein
MSKRKAAKAGGKDLREAMLERLETVGSTEPVVGEIVAEEAMKENGSYEQSVTLLIDMSVRTGDIKSVTFQFYNGRGTRSGVYLH